MLTKKHNVPKGQPITAGVENRKNGTGKLGKRKATISPEELERRINALGEAIVSTEKLDLSKIGPSTEREVDREIRLFIRKLRPTEYEFIPGLDEEPDTDKS